MHRNGKKISKEFGLNLSLLNNVNNICFIQRYLERENTIHLTLFVQIGHVFLLVTDTVDKHSYPKLHNRVKMFRFFHVLQMKLKY